MRRFVIAASAAVFTLASAAPRPMQCTNPDILNGLVFLGRSDMKMNVTLGSPGFMGDFHAPAGFSLIGTGVRPMGMSIVAYKTSLPGGKAYEALVAALGAEGWGTEARPLSGATFNVAGAPRETTLCRDGERRSLLVTESAGVSYVSLLSSPVARRDCNSPDPVMEMMYGMGRNAAPRFQFPAGTTLAQGGGGGGGSNQVYNTSTRIISAESPARLVEHLASQIENQGWRPDSGWSAAGNAGSTWRKAGDGKAATNAVLQIVRVSEGTYEVNFTLLSAE